MTPHEALEAAAAVVEANGFCRRYLWDTAQAAAGVPPEFCRVDITGALAVALHGSPWKAATAEVREAEQLLAGRVPAPSLAAWCSYPGIGKRDVLRLLRTTAAVPAP